MNANSQSKFKDQVVLINGAGNEIGRVIAQAFAAQEAILAINDINPLNLSETLQRIQMAGGRARDYVFDVAKKMPVQAMIDQVLDDWGRIDVLVNNAAVEPRISILEMDEWDWHRTMDVNLSGPFFTMQLVGRAMRQQGGGVIVNIASSTGWMHGLKDRAAYLTSKMGLIGLTRTAAREFAPYHIRVNAVCPGVIETELTTALLGDQVSIQRWLEEIPLGRAGRAEDLAGLVLFLCSPDAAYLTGQAINVDGGKIGC
jgi:3-oxoacyl-[acyl-carrier protein] reductase